MKDKNNFPSVILASLYTLGIIFWILFFLFAGNEATYEGPFYLYLLKPFLILMTTIPLFGGIIGLSIAKKWGMFSSVFGRSVFALSLGTIAWGSGMIVWNYYLFFTDIEVPYPSVADGVFILSWPLWALGVIYIGKVIGVKYGFKKLKGKLVAIFGPLFAIIVSYFLLFQVARSGEFDLNVSDKELFFNIFYPVGDIAILSLIAVVYILSKSFLGGIYKNPIRILFFGFLLNYFADFVFSYTNTTETYFNGHIVDLMYMSAMFLISLSILNLRPKLKKE